MKNKTIKNMIVLKKVEWPEKEGFENIKLYAKYVTEEIENQLQLDFPDFIEGPNPFDVIRQYVSGEITQDEYFNYGRALAGYCFLDDFGKDALWVRLARCIVPGLTKDEHLTDVLDYLICTLYDLGLITEIKDEGVLKADAFE